MNKSDMLKDAMRLDSMGVDPDKIMVGLTIEEYAKSVDDEVDEFDEVKKENYQIEVEVSVLDAEIMYIQSQIEHVKKLFNAAVNFAQRIDFREEIIELEKRKYNLENKKNMLLTLYENNKDAINQMIKR